MRAQENVDELRAYQGYVNYYDRFIPNKAEIFSPVYSLLKKDTPYQWTNEYQTAMDTVKKILSASLVLAFYDAKKTLRLQVMETGRELMWCSAMWKTEKSYPSFFVSRALKKSELNYLQLEIEA